MSNGSGRLLLDTNVLVYAHDPRNRRKQELALTVLDRAIATERATVSAQNLSEFFVVVTQRLPERLEVRAALRQVEHFAASCRVLEVTALVVLEACRGVQVRGTSAVFSTRTTNGGTIANGVVNTPTSLQVSINTSG